MDKDMVVVSRVRYRFDTILKSLPMRDISIPPALKRKRGTKVKIEDITQNIPDRKSTRLNSSHSGESRMPSSA